MSQFTIESPDAALETVCDQLISWWDLRNDSERGRFMDERTKRLLPASLMLGEIINVVQPYRNVKLTVGQKVLEAVHIPYGYHGFASRTSSSLHPTTEHLITSSRRHLSASPWLHDPSNTSTPTELFLSTELGLKIPISAVAQTLTENGNLLLVPGVVELSAA